MVHLVKQFTWHVSNLHLFLLNTENSCAENWNSLYTSCQLQSILKVIIIASTRHVVHIQLEKRRQLLEEGRLFVTDPGLCRDALALQSGAQGSASTSDTAGAHQCLRRENWSLEGKAQDKNEGLLLFRAHRLEL